MMRVRFDFHASGFRGWRGGADLIWTHVLRPIRDAFAMLLGEIRTVGAQYLRLDWPLALIILFYSCLFLPLVSRNADNPQMLAAFVNDEPFQVMALEATQVWPFGNPANFFKQESPNYMKIPQHWGAMRYPNITYYGGSTYQIALP